MSSASGLKCFECEYDLCDANQKPRFCSNGAVVSTDQLSSCDIKTLNVIHSVIRRPHWITQQNNSFTRRAASPSTSGTWPAAQRSFRRTRHMKSTADLFPLMVSIVAKKTYATTGHQKLLKVWSLLVILYSKVATIPLPSLEYSVSSRS